MKARSHRLGVVAVRHPDLKRLRQAVKERRLGDDLDLGVAVLARGCGRHAAAEVMRHELQTVADAERRQACREHLRIGLRRSVVVDARRPAREDDALGLQREHALERRGARKHHRKHIQLANSASDELCVLRSEVQNDDG